ncbi:MAG: NAD(P)H-dependent oxidoreductase [Cytophagales bacterium]|nr:NAD(P)H-dependent oxidoreductase [Cytophagales bacterium]
MKKVLIIQGSPDKESYCNALAMSYLKGLNEAGAGAELIQIGDLNFSPNLGKGYRKRTELEPDLLASWKKIQWADHIVLIHPVWWGGLPALTKGFFDRLFLPGFAFQKREGSLWWDKLLTNKSGRVIATMDQPAWFYWLGNFAPSHFAVKRMTFQFSGLKPVHTTSIGPIRLSTEKFREKWLHKIYKLGLKQK